MPKSWEQTGEFWAFEQSGQGWQIREETLYDSYHSSPSGFNSVPCGKRLRAVPNGWPVDKVDDNGHFRLTTGDGTTLDLYLNDPSRGQGAPL